MPFWTFFDYVEKSGRNPIREWLDGLPEDDHAKIDYRLIQMAAMRPPWPEKWISKYRTTELFEFRITGNKVQYRPLGIYWGRLRYVLLAGAIEKGDRIPKSDIDTAERRLSDLRKDPMHHAVIHQFDGEEDLEEDGTQGVS
jgi:phage-related protein